MSCPPCWLRLALGLKTQRSLERILHVKVGRGNFPLFRQVCKPLRYSDNVFESPQDTNRSSTAAVSQGARKRANCAAKERGGHWSRDRARADVDRKKVDRSGDMESRSVILGMGS
jgi:hypothetical protein